MIINNEDVQSTGTEGIWVGLVTGKFYFIYFSDEAYDLNGPYDTIPEAVAASAAYGDWLTNGPKAVNGTGNLPQSTVKYYGG